MLRVRESRVRRDGVRDAGGPRPGPEAAFGRATTRAREVGDDSPTTKDPTSGEVVFDGEALEAATKGPRMRIVEMEERVGGEGFVDEDEGAGESRAGESRARGPGPGAESEAEGRAPGDWAVDGGAANPRGGVLPSVRTRGLQAASKTVPARFSQRAAPRAEFYF